MIDNSQDIIDSRDVLARIAELEDEVSDNPTKENTDELDALVKLQVQAEDYCEDWEYGVTLIRDSYFTEYAQELADDIAVNLSGAGWPMRHIDWEAAAAELKQDYTAISFDGVTYWVR